MQKFNYLVAVTLVTICGLVTCNRTPQFLYLQMMRDRLQSSMAKDCKESEMASAPTISTVTGLSSDGLFSISKGSVLNVAIPCSSMKSSSSEISHQRAIYSANLWLFPKPGDNVTSSEADTTQGETYTVSFTVSITTDANTRASSTSRKTKVIWNRGDTCMELDITRAVKSYSKAAQQDGLTDQCTISVTVRNISPVRGSNGDDQQLAPTKICSAFNGRTCSKPFIFFTHVQGIIHQLDSNTAAGRDDGNHGNHDGIAKRLVILEDVPANDICGVQKLMANLTGTPLQVVYPTIVDIGVCRGSCTSGLPNAVAASFRHSLLVSNPQYLIDAENGGVVAGATPCCSPGSYDPLMIVIDDTFSTSIIAIHEAVVTDCKCVV